MDAAPEQRASRARGREPDREAAVASEPLREAGPERARRHACTEREALHPLRVVREEALEIARGPLRASIAPALAQRRADRVPRRPPLVEAEVARRAGAAHERERAHERGFAGSTSLSAPIR